MENNHIDSLLDIEKVISILNKIAIFGALSEKQLYKVFRLLHKSTYKKNSFIFNQGDHSENIFIVMSGKVELVLDAKGEYLAKGLFTAGECFGETGVIGIEKHTASAIAIEETELIVFPRKKLFDLWETDRDLFAMLILNIAREACRRLNQSDEVILRYFSERKKF